jgi:Ala-tRNA(Pro) deacylase
VSRTAVTERLERWLREAGVPFEVLEHLRADNAALRAVVGTRTLRFATPDELHALTGCVPGAVPPFGNLFGLPVLVDEALCANERVVFNAGSPAVSITMRCDDLVRVSGATVCRFAARDGSA